MDDPKRPPDDTIPRTPAAGPSPAAAPPRDAGPEAEPQDAPNYDPAVDGGRALAVEDLNSANDE